MDPCTEQRLIQLLRDSASPAMSVRNLHAALVAEPGGEPGSYALLEEWLRRRGDVFVLLEPASPFGDDDAWPAAARSEYERELVAAGYDTGPHVSLVDPATEPDDTYPSATPGGPADVPLRQMRDSLLRIWQTSGENASLRKSVVAALAGCTDLPAALREGDDAAS